MTNNKAYFYRRIVMAKLFIDRSYAEAIDVDAIASEGAFSKHHFIRQFKKTYGKTPYNYLKAVRIDRACELLKDGQQVQDVCFAVGYDSLSSFSGLFKKSTGHSPTEFQALHAARAEGIAQKPLAYIPGCFADKNGWKNSNFEEVKPQ